MLGELLVADGFCEEWIGGGGGLGLWSDSCSYVCG
jgi:hypothetical protein